MAGCFLCRLEIAAHPYLPEAYASVAVNRAPGAAPAFSAYLDRMHEAGHPALFSVLREALRRARPL